MTHNSSASSSKCSITTRPKSSSKPAETGTTYASSKPGKVQAHNIDRFSNHISDKIEENKGYTVNDTTDVTHKAANANNKVNKDVQHKARE